MSSTRDITHAIIRTLNLTGGEKERFLNLVVIYLSRRVYEFESKDLAHPKKDRRYYRRQEKTAIRNFDKEMAKATDLVQYAMNEFRARYISDSRLN